MAPQQYDSCSVWCSKQFCTNNPIHLGKRYCRIHPLCKKQQILKVTWHFAWRCLTNDCHGNQYSYRSKGQTKQFDFLPGTSLWLNWSLIFPSSKISHISRSFFLVIFHHLCSKNSITHTFLTFIYTKWITFVWSNLQMKSGYHQIFAAWVAALFEMNWQHSTYIKWPFDLTKFFPLVSYIMLLYIPFFPHSKLHTNNTILDGTLFCDNFQWKMHPSVRFEYD